MIVFAAGSVACALMCIVGVFSGFSPVELIVISLSGLTFAVLYVAEVLLRVLAGERRW